MNQDEIEMLNWKIGQQEFVNQQHRERTDEVSEEWWLKTYCKQHPKYEWESYCVNRRLGL